jgi:hypothetical protein
MDEELIQKVWEKGRVIANYNPDLFRQDVAGAWMIREQYGNTDSMFGWQIDHIYPRALGGTDALFNLRPMQWMNNRSKGDNYPKYLAKVISRDNRNVEEDTPCVVSESTQKEIANHYGSH